MCRLRIGATALIALMSCIGCNELHSQGACVDEVAGDLIVNFTNDLSFDIEVPRNYPSIACCGHEGFFIYLSDKDGAELPRCGLLSGIDGAPDVVVEPGGRFDYKLSADSISSAYCDVDLTDSHLSVVYASAGNEHNFYDGPIRLGECAL